MYMIARLYDSEAKANAAASELSGIGVKDDYIAVLSSPAAASEAPGEGEEAAPAADSATPTDMATAIKVGKMLGGRADYYLSRLEAGRTLLVATPHFMLSAAAEKIVDSHDPMPVTHEREAKKFVPVSQQASPFSDFLGLGVLSRSTQLTTSDSITDDLSHISRIFEPLSPGFTLSEKVGWGFKAKSDTLSARVGWPISSDRLKDKDSSFGMKFKADRGQPFSSLLGLPLLSKRDHYIMGEAEDIS